MSDMQLASIDEVTAVKHPMGESKTILRVRDVSKRFTLHLRDSMPLKVIDHATFTVSEGQCVILDGPSGIGKSSLLKMVYGSYRTESGEIHIAHRGQFIDAASCSERVLLQLRRETVSYVSQFLRVVPRVSALDVVAAPLVEKGESMETSHQRAQELLARLNLPESLWTLPPATFSGGEQQRINIARGFIAPSTLLLLDEPTASLDRVNSRVVVELIQECKQQGTAMLGICHDRTVREAVADELIDVRRFTS